MSTLIPRKGQLIIRRNQYHHFLNHSYLFAFKFIILNMANKFFKIFCSVSLIPTTTIYKTFTHTSSFFFFPGIDMILVMLFLKIPDRNMARKMGRSTLRREKGERRNGAVGNGGAERRRRGGAAAAAAAASNQGDYRPNPQPSSMGQRTSRGCGCRARWNGPGPPFLGSGTARVPVILFTALTSQHRSLWPTG